MKIKIIIKHRKTDRAVFRFLALITTLWIFSSSFAPVKFEKIIVTDIPINWRVTIEKNNETIIQDYVLKIRESRRVVITAYSSTVDQTDERPFETALGTHVRDGIIACNFLKFGARVLIPEEFGYNKVFTVEDRMARRHKDRVDIWFPSRWEAEKFGIKKREILVLEN